MKSGNYTFPSSELLEGHKDETHMVSEEEIPEKSKRIIEVLKGLMIKVENVSTIVGPTVTLYKIVPAKGIKISAIRNHEEDIAFALNTRSVRIVTLPDSVGIEVVNDRQSTVPLKAMLSDEAFTDSKAELPVAMGVDIFNKVKVFDLADAPHLLIAGASNQGKTTGINAIITSLLYAKHPSELKFVLIDPKMVEFTRYSKLIRHYLAVLPDTADEKAEPGNAIVKQPKLAEDILSALCVEMDERNQLISQAEVRNIKEYNSKYRDGLLRPDDGHHFLPYIVVVIDEYADLTIPWGISLKSKGIAKNIMSAIIRLAQKGRAAGIHIIIATQRPSDDVITGLIKANFPTRIAFRVSTRTDSITILDSPGAEHLIGKGDMLYSVGKEMERMQCAYITLDEISKIVDFIAAQTESAEGPYILPKPHNEANEDEKKASVPVTEFDPLFEEVAEYVVKRAEVSVSDLQRKFAVGYCRGCRIMEQLESVGIVTSGQHPDSAHNSNGNYSVLVKGKKELAKILSGINSQEQREI